MEKIQNIVPAKFEDFEGIVPLYRQLWPEWDYDEAKVKAIFAEDLQTGRKKYFFTRLPSDPQGKVVAVAAIAFKNDLHRYQIAILDELIVTEELRGQGIGGMMLEFVCDYVAKMGLKIIELESNLHRLDAHRFYEKNGFEKLGFYFRKYL